MLFLLLISPVLGQTNLEYNTGQERYSEYDNTIYNPQTSHKYFEDPYGNEPEYFEDYSQMTWNNIQQKATEVDWVDMTTRTLALEGVDFDFIFNRLVSPRGLITQYALSLELEIFQNIGWILSGMIWNFALTVTEGQLQADIASLSFIYSPQALALTMIRSLWNRLLEIVARITAAIIVFSAPETFSQISEVTPVDIGDFLFNPQLTILSLGRGVTIVFWLTLFAIPTYFFSADVWPVIRPPAPVPTNTTAAGRSGKDSCPDFFHHPASEYILSEEDFCESESFREFNAKGGVELLFEDIITKIIETIPDNLSYTSQPTE
ncbi:uncharacterized protein LOC111700524 [Eurytemora carolleeae]|uniref:uncharacterized protein LOC111700524 n=1 Tax=Eurytemora carolleeae TaxID=1294199 RepID=UPI000C772A71|nr:uncharacterized protein LOC111700524 [Eurytemora carolleeae]|eukprot:XP_023327229.1 uncharacterized protein LOC111700524 [Eurytemora affinis]